MEFTTKNISFTHIIGFVVVLAFTVIFALNTASNWTNLDQSQVNGAVLVTSLLTVFTVYLASVAWNSIRTRRQ